MSHNWLNNTARTLNGKIFEGSKRQPSVRLRTKWHQEFIDQKLDFKMSFREYLKKKTQEWHKQKRK